MDIAFLDTNALMKLYIPEKGSNWLQSFTSTRQINVSELALIETVTVLRRLHLEGKYSIPDVLNFIAQINLDSTNFEIVLLTGKPFRDKLTDLVIKVSVGLRIRALDAIHLTAASIAQERVNLITPKPTFTFVSSDVQLLRVAQAQGLQVENPENYP
jgi:predicted nucleic acid-binding protein